MNEEFVYMAAGLLVSLVQQSCAEELPAVLAAHAAANNGLHRLLLSPYSLKYLARRSSVAMIEWLHSYRVAHGQRAAPCGGLLELAVRLPKAMLECLQRLKYIAPDLYRAGAMPRNLLAVAHSTNIEWVRVQGQFSNAEILSWLPNLLARPGDDQINIVKWLRSLPQAEMTGEMPKLSHFTESQIITYVCHNNFVMLDWLVEQGADPNAWGAVFANALARDCCVSTVQWFDKNTRFVAHPELLSRSATQTIVQSCNFWPLMLSATRPYWLWALVHYGRIKLTSHCYRKLTTRENCMAHNGRVLRAIAAKKSCARRWRSLVRQCQLTPSDFASFGLAWPC